MKFEIYARSFLPNNFKKIAMNVVTAAQSNISALIEELQKQKDTLTAIYHAAITNGEKYDEVKTLYITLKDVDKRLSDLMRICL